MIRRCKIAKKIYILGGIVSNTNQTLKIFLTNMLLSRVVKKSELDMLF